MPPWACRNRILENRMIVGFFPATTMPDADRWRALWPDPMTLLVEMGVQPGMVVVDLCCGDGLFTAPLARIVDSVYAIDIDPAMLDRGRLLLQLVRPIAILSWRTL